MNEAKTGIEAPASLPTRVVKAVRNFFAEQTTEVPLTQAETRQRKMESDLLFLKNTYNLDVDMGYLSENDKRYVNFCMPPRDYERPDIVRALTEAVTKYPPEYVEYTKVKTVRLVRDLKASGVFGENASILGASTGTGLMYVNVAAGIPIAKQAFHHEMFHEGDAVFGSGIFGSAKTILFNCSWLGLNPNGYKDYMDPEQYGKLNEFGTYFLQRAGFVSGDAAINEKEDRAVTAEGVMTNTMGVKRLADQDPVFFKKMRRILKLFKQRSNGRMDLNYFNDLIAGRVGEDYWFKDKTPIKAA